MKSVEHYIGVLRRRVYRRILKNKKLAHYLSKHCLKLYLAMFYENWVGKRMNYRHPQDMSQELIKLSYLNSRDEKMRKLIPMCTDKYGVREYIKSKGYEDILNELYGVYDNVEDIDFDILPNQFVMKMTNACGLNWVCTDKSQADWPTIKKKFIEWLKDDDFAWETGEWQYAMIKPRIIVEKYLKDLGENSLVDYKLHVIRGKAYGFFIGYNRDTDIMHDPTKRGVCFDCYTPEWKLTEDITPEWHPNRMIIPKPKSLKRMIQIAEDCSKEFDYCRFDMYDINGKIVFGEMTFSPHGGVLDYYTDEYQKKMQQFYHEQK